jgi:GT2 family glycosyltransferase
VAPRFSICIPSFQHGEFIGATLASALTSAPPDAEIVILDDGSKDDTLEILSKFQDGRLRVEQNERHLGLAGNFNRCLEVARGAYLKILCDDDLLYPGAIETLVTALERFPSATFATSAWNVIDESSTVTKTMRCVADAPPDGRLVDLSEIAASSWLYKNRIGGPSSVMIRTESLRTLKFNPDFSQMVDWEFWLRALARGPLVCVPAVLSAYRRHSGATTASQRGGTAEELLRISLSLTSAAAPERAILRSNVKRLQILCFLRAAGSALGCAATGRFRTAAHDAGVAKRAIVALTHRT